MKQKSGGGSPLQNGADGSIFIPHTNKANRSKNAAAAIMRYLVNRRQ